jgi:hypothetical protein
MKFFQIININGDESFKVFLLGYNLTVGTVFKFEYSPSYSKLVNLFVLQKNVCLRKEDFKNIEYREVE